jgi:hypothetical protein
MSGEVTALLLLLGASVGLACNIAAVTSIALIAGATLAARVTPLVDTKAPKSFAFVVRISKFDVELFTRCRLYHPFPLPTNGNAGSFAIRCDSG